MTGIVVNELVTKFTARYDRTFAQYERKLNQMDKMGAKMGAKAGNSFASSFERANGRVGARMSAALKGLQRQANGIKINPTIRVSGASQAIGQIRQVKSEMEKLNKGIGSISLGGALTGGLAALGVGKAAGFGYNAAKEYENSMMRLRTLMGDSGARNSYSALQKFAAVTPYELPEVVDMFTRLQGAGYNIADRKTGKIDFTKLTRLGDLASTSNKSLAELVDAMLSSGRGLGSMVDNFIGLGAKASGDGYLDATMTDIKTGAVKKMELNSANKDQMLQFWLDAGARQGVSGGMGNLAKTLEGQMATLTDTTKGLFAKMWLGMEKPVHKFLGQMIQGLDKMEPKFRAIGVQVGLGLRKVPAIAKEVAKWAPIAAAGIGLMGAKIIGLKYIAAAELLGKVAFEMRSVGVATYFTSGALKGLLVGSGIGALVLLFADFVEYLATGDSTLVRFTERWPKLNKFIKDSYYWSGIFLDALGEGVNYWMGETERFLKHVFKRVQEYWKMFADSDAGKIFLRVVDGTGSAINKYIFGDTGGADTGETTSRSVIAGGRGGAGLANSALQWITSGEADKFAKADKFKIWWKGAYQGIYQAGVACDYTVGRIVKLSGASEKLVNQFSNTVPTTFDNLKNKGYAVEVPWDQVLPGDIAYNAGLTHTGIIGPGGKTNLIHSSNQAGKGIGKGQRPVSANNYFGSGGRYLRIKPQYLSGGQTSVTNNITVNSGSQANGRDIARQTSKAATDGTAKALSKASNRYSRPTSE
jgi:hypothetical protein